MFTERERITVRTDELRLRHPDLIMACGILVTPLTPQKD